MIAKIGHSVEESRFVLGYKSPRLKQLKQ